MAVSAELFQDIAKNYGKVASWALWVKPGSKPKSNIGDMSILDIDKNPRLLDSLRTDIVMVALNFAREVETTESFLNFHDRNPHGQDYKLRYAFQDTEFEGAYMTDIIKDFPMLRAADVLKHLRQHPGEAEKQVSAFRAELKFIGARNPRILALGRDAYKILSDHLEPSEYSQLVPLTHYSHQISKERYRAECLERLR